MSRSEASVPLPSKVAEKSASIAAGHFRKLVLATGVGFDGDSHVLGGPTPMRGSVEPSDPRRDACEPIASGPAHHGGEGVDARASPELPEARIRLVPDAHRLLTDDLQQFEELASAPVEQARIEERLGRGEHGRSIDVVLDVLVRLIADAHGPHPAIAGERRLERSMSALSRPIP